MEKFALELNDIMLSYNWSCHRISNLKIDDSVRF